MWDSNLAIADDLVGFLNNFLGRDEIIVEATARREKLGMEQRIREGCVTLVLEGSWSASAGLLATLGFGIDVISSGEVVFLMSSSVAGAFLVPRSFSVGEGLRTCWSC